MMRQQKAPRFQRAPVTVQPKAAAETDPTAELDDYEISHLTEHLEAVRDLGTLNKLLRLEWLDRTVIEPPRPGFLKRLRGRADPPVEQARSHPAWFEAKNRLNRSGDFIEDVLRIWRLSAEAVGDALASGTTSAALGTQARCALILASVNSYSAAIPLSLLTALVRGDVWTAGQAVAHARRIPEPNERLKALTALLALLPDTLLAEVAEEAVTTALDAAQAGNPKGPSTPNWDEQQVFPDELVALLPDRLVREAFGRELGSRGSLLRRLAELGHVDEAVRLAAGDRQRLTDIAAYLPEDMVRSWLAVPSAGLGDYRNREELPRRLADLGHVADAAQMAAEDPRLLAAIAPHLSREQVTRGLTQPWPADLYMRLAPQVYASQDDVSRLLAAPRPHALYLRLAALGDPEPALRLVSTLPYGKSDLLIALAPYLSGAQAAAGKALAETQLDEDDQARFLIALATSEPEPYRTACLDDAVSLLPRLGSHRTRELLDQLIPLLDERQLNRVLTLARKSPRWVRLPALLTVAAVAADPLRDQALTAAAAAPGYNWLDALPAWARVDPHKALAQAMSAHRVGDPDVIDALAPLLPRDLLVVALASVGQVGDLTWQRTRLQTQAAVGLAAVDPGEGLRRLSAIPEATDRSLGLIELAGELPEEALPLAVYIASGIRTGDDRVPALTALAPRLTGELLDLALEACRGSYERLWAEALGAFAPYLEREKLLAALAEAHEIEDPVWRLAAYAGMIPHLAPPELQEIERRTLALGADTPRRDTVLRGLADALALPGQSAGSAEPAQDNRESGAAEAADPLSQAAWLDGQRAEAEEAGDLIALATLTARFGNPPAATVLDQAEVVGNVDVVAILAPVLSPQQAARARDLVRSAPRVFPPRTAARCWPWPTIPPSRPAANCSRKHCGSRSTRYRPGTLRSKTSATNVRCGATCAPGSARCPCRASIPCCSGPCWS